MSAHIILPFVFLQIATVACIVFFLRMLLHKQLEIGMSRIKKLDSENLQKEAELDEKLAKFNREYDEKIKFAEEHAESLITAAKEDAKKMKDEEREKAKEESRRIIAGALSEKENVLRDTQKNVQTKAIEIAEKILKDMFSSDELSGLREKISREQFNEFIQADNIVELLKTRDKIEIITSDQLNMKEKENMEKEIEKLSEKKINIKFSEDKEILGGLVLKVGERIIDGGIYNRIIQVVMKMKEDV